MSLCEVLIVLFIFLYSVVNVDHANFVIEYKGFNIVFTDHNFTEFYKCLCNPVMGRCWASTETTERNITDVNIAAVRQKYDGLGGNEQPLRTCNVTQSKDLNNFLINCTRSVKSSHSLSFKPVTQSLNDSCIHSNVKLDWPPDVRIVVYSSLIQIKNELGTAATPTEVNKHKQPIEGDPYTDIMTILLSLTGICICIVVTVLLLRKRNIICQLFDRSKLESKESKDGCKEESDYAYIDDTYPIPPSKYSGLRNIVRNLKHPYNSASTTKGQDKFGLQDLNSNDQLTIVESYSITPKIEVLKLFDQTDQSDRVISIGSENQLYINEEVGVGVGEDDYRPEVQARAVNVIGTDTGPDYSVVNLNE